MNKFSIFLLISLLLFWTSCSGWSEIKASEIWKTKTILALGDSLTAWFWVPEEDNYPSQLSELLVAQWYNYAIENAGVSWDTSQDLLERAPSYLDHNPDIVLLVIWGNDGLRSLDTENMKENILEIIDLYDDGERKIVLGGMQIPIHFWLWYSQKFKAVYKDISKERKNIYFMKHFLEDVSWYAQYNLADKIHPNKAGYDIIVTNVYDFLQDEDIISK